MTPRSRTSEVFAPFGPSDRRLGGSKGDVVFAITEGGETLVRDRHRVAGAEAGARVGFVFNNPDEVLRATSSAAAR